jgi:hypothetical protein
LLSRDFAQRAACDSNFPVNNFMLELPQTGILLNTDVQEEGVQDVSFLGNQMVKLYEYAEYACPVISYESRLKTYFDHFFKIR